MEKLYSRAVEFSGGAVCSDGVEEIINQAKMQGIDELLLERL